MIYAMVLVTMVCFFAGVWIPTSKEVGYSVFGYALSHANWWHMALNCFAMLGFGLGVERRMGAWGMLLLYLAAVGFGAVVQMGYSDAPMVGASAGVYGLMFAYAMLYPNKRVWLVLLPMSALGAMVTATILTLASLSFGWMPQVAHMAHLSGGVMGVIWVLALDRG